ncbi:MAG: MerR family transcriptional regulator [Limosilactobacillus reuteri]|nr:MerR family transcriptional regulator [Limosilactobacillus reuteri]
MVDNEIRMSSKEVADFFGLSTDTLRFYERKGIIPPVKRDKNGYRIYTDFTMNWLYIVLNLKRAGLSLDKIAEFTQLSTTPQPNILKAQKQLLQEQYEEITKRIASLQDMQKVLKWKLDNFDNHFFTAKDGQLAVRELKREWVNYRK